MSKKPAKKASRRALRLRYYDDNHRVKRVSVSGATYARLQARSRIENRSIASIVTALILEGVAPQPLPATCRALPE